MNIVIIEDEQPARERLENMLKEIVPVANIAVAHDSVKAAHKWFLQNPLPDLVFLDIQLGDGTAFDLLKLINIDCPIIFTTAYSKYALDAFKEKSIDYLLKPVKKTELEGALTKLKELKQLFNKQGILPELKKPAAKEYKKRFMIRLGEHIRTVSIDNVAYFVSENKCTFARTYEGLSYPLDSNLDTLEEILDPQMFFRINRQYLISLKSIEEMKMYTKSRVIIKMKPETKELPVVSGERAADFKLWLAGEL